MKERHRSELGENFNEGARRLWVTMLKRGESAEDVTRSLGVARGMVGRWLYGDRRPDRSSTQRLVEKYRIPASAWDEEPTEAFAIPEHEPRRKAG